VSDARKLVYVPLDRMLSMQSVRVLRALRHFDWALVGEIRESMRAPTARPVWLALGKHVEAGRVERDGSRYRITVAGRTWLDGMLARSRLPEVAA
jgi:hypothetical protein